MDINPLMLIQSDMTALVLVLFLQKKVEPAEHTFYALGIQSIKLIVGFSQQLFYFLGHLTYVSHTNICLSMCTNNRLI